MASTTSPTPPAALGAAWQRVEEACAGYAKLATSAECETLTSDEHETKVYAMERAAVSTMYGVLRYLAARRACVEAGYRECWVRTCPDCNGSGAVPENVDQIMVPCCHCEGRGWVP